MEISKKDIEWAHAQGLISATQVEPLWAALEGRARGRARFDFPHVTYYFGALVVMSAMGWFVNRAWERFGGAGLLLIAVVYALCFSLAGLRLWVRQGLRVPGGLLFTLAVWMTPLGIYGFERMTGMWPQHDPGAYRNYYEWVKGGWFFMEVGTILAGLGALRFVRFPFLTFPVAVALWFMSMDLTPLIYGRSDFTWNQRARGRRAGDPLAWNLLSGPSNPERVSDRRSPAGGFSWVHAKAGITGCDEVSSSPRRKKHAVPAMAFGSALRARWQPVAGCVPR